ncbi:MAG: AsmA-like C-terminal domain-containing protein [Candidatus Manganitrophus sp.]|nr:AsmA-like C-terminal domain-containing protein [Candidatus Manganitrophus sp.]
MSRFKTRSLFNGPNRRPGIAALFLLLLAFILFILPEWITLNRLIPSFSERFQTATGRTLSLNKIGLSFVSGPQLRLYGVVVGGREEVRPLAEAHEVRIGFQLLPLLWKRFEIVEIRLIEPTVSLVRDKEGEWNFDDLLPWREKEAGGGWTVAARSGIFTVQQGRFSLVDRTVPGNPLEWTAQRIEARFRRPFWDGRVDVKIDIPSLWQGVLVGKATHLKVDGWMEGEGGLFGFKREMVHIAVSVSRFDSDLVGPYLPDAVPPFLSESGRLTIVAQNADLLRIRQLLRSRETRLEGEARQVSVTLSKDLPPVTIEQTAWHFEGREGRFTLRNAKFSDSTLPETTGQLHSLPEERKLEIQTAGQISLTDAAEVASKRFGSERMKRLKTEGSVEADLKIKIPLGPAPAEFNGRLLVRDGAVTPFSAFRPIRKINGTVRLEGKQLLIDSAEGEWGAGRLAGTGKMPDLYDDGIEFDLHATTLDWDALRRVPDAADSPRTGEERPKEPKPDAPNPDEDDSEGRGYAVGLLRIDHLKLKEYDFSNVQSAMIYREKTLQFRETEANFDDGVFKADFAQAYFRPDGSVALALTPNLEQISVAAFFADFRGDGERPLMSGRGLVAGGLNTVGSNLQEFKKNLEGNLVVYLERGKIYRFRALARIFALMNLRSIPDLDVKGIEYDVLSGSLSIERGKVALHDTVLFGRDVRVIANGKIDLVKNEFDLLMGVQVFRLVDDILKQLPIAGPILLGKDQMFIASYFEVEGKLTDPRVRFRPFKSIKESTLAVLRRALTFPVRPEAFSG